MLMSFCVNYSFHCPLPFISYIFFFWRFRRLPNACNQMVSWFRQFFFSFLFLCAGSVSVDLGGTFSSLLFPLIRSEYWRNRGQTTWRRSQWQWHRNQVRIQSDWSLDFWFPGFTSASFPYNLFREYLLEGTCCSCWCLVRCPCISDCQGFYHSHFSPVKPIYFFCPYYQTNGMLLCWTYRVTQKHVRHYIGYSTFSRYLI